MDRLSMMNARGKQVSSPDSALASDLFDKFCNATTMKTILGYHRQLCDVTNLKPNHINAFYPKLKVIYILIIKLVEQATRKLEGRGFDPHPDIIIFYLKNCDKYIFCSCRLVLYWDNFFSILYLHGGRKHCGRNSMFVLVINAMPGAKHVRTRGCSLLERDPVGCEPPLKHSCLEPKW